MTIDLNGITLFYEVQGSGSPLILLHGNGEDHSIFNELADKLKEHFTVYMIDSRNHGQSSKTKDFSYNTMAEDIYAFIRSLSLTKVNLIGFSDGAIISLILAMKHPESLAKMALLGINLSPDDFNEKSYQFIKNTYEKTKNPLFKMMLEEPNIKLEEVKNLDIPIFVIGAENDIYKPDTFKNLADALPDAKLKIMPGHTHESYVVNQDILYPDLLAFFE